MGCIASFFVWSQGRITATVTNFEGNKGVCRACLFASEEAFEKSKALQCVEATVANRRAQVTFSSVPQGTYALFVFHDRNRNNRMDKNLLGIPSEGYGASRNRLPFAAAPRFADNKFSVQDNTTVSLSVRLRNL